MAEVLVRAGRGRAQFVSILSDRIRFQIVPFDARAAIEAAELIALVKSNSESWGTHAKVKFDIQIVATAKAEDATLIYSDDHDIENFAKRLKIPVLRICDLPLPPPPVAPEIDAGPIGKQRDLFDTPQPLLELTTVSAPGKINSNGESAESAIEVAKGSHNYEVDTPYSAPIRASDEELVESEAAGKSSVSTFQEAETQPVKIEMNPEKPKAASDSGSGEDGH